jgi:hypothetical protein
MAFGQQSGPPASAKQVRDLLTLVQAAGHADFREARGPMGLTQRQAAGKFTRDEATVFIDSLEEAEAAEGGAIAGAPPDPSPASPYPPPAPQAPRSAGEEARLRRVPVEQLASELERRGWIVIPPP